MFANSLHFFSFRYIIALPQELYNYITIELYNHISSIEWQLIELIGAVCLGRSLQ